MNWFALATTGRKEPLAGARLASVGFEVFLPQVIGKRGEKEVAVIEQLFPGYVLTYADPIDLQVQLALWRQSHTATGIQKLITSPTNTPLSISSDDVFEIKLRTDPLTNIFTPDYFFIPQSQPEPLKPGDIIHTLEGSGWSNHIGKIARLKGSDRAVVLLHILGCEREVTMEKRFLSKEIPDISYN